MRRVLLVKRPLFKAPLVITIDALTIGRVDPVRNLVLGCGIWAVVLYIFAVYVDVAPKFLLFEVDTTACYAEDMF